MGELVQRRIFVVEDEPDLRATLAELLSLHGYDVACAANGVEALQLLRRGPVPNLIVLDLMMPVMDGWQFRAELDKYPVLAKIPVLLLSAHHELMSQADGLHVVGALTKPVALTSVIRAVRTLC